MVLPDLCCGQPKGITEPDAAQSTVVDMVKKKKKNLNWRDQFKEWDMSERRQQSGTLKPPHVALCLCVCVIHICGWFVSACRCSRPHKMQFHTITSSSSSSTNCCILPQKPPLTKSLITVMNWVSLPVFPPQPTENKQRKINRVGYRSPSVNLIASHPWTE